VAAEVEQAVLVGTERPDRLRLLAAGALARGFLLVAREPAAGRIPAVEFRERIVAEGASRGGPPFPLGRKAEALAAHLRQPCRIGGGVTPAHADHRAVGALG